MIPVPEPRSRSGCATCTTARCCVVFDPEMTGADLQRMVRGLGLAPADIAELRPVRRDQGGPDAIVLADDCTFELRLRRSARPPASDTSADAARRCGFLVGLAPGVNRCGAYAHRPMVCRTFPTELTPFGVMVATPEAICPPDAWSQARADLAGLAALHARAQCERRLHHAFVARWNADPPGTTFDVLTAAMLGFWDAIAPLLATALDASDPRVQRALDQWPGLTTYRPA